jgi:SAM-dependent methyltransferase
LSNDPAPSIQRSRWRGVVQDTGDRLFDRFLGIETSRPVWHGDLEFEADAGGYYQASNWVNLVILWRLLRALRVARNDVFIDFGCGKGQVLALASRFPFGRVIGLDLSPHLIRLASQNMARIRGRASAGTIELVQSNALDYAIPDDLTVAYFYMPFPTTVYEALVARVAESLTRAPRPFRIIYLEEAVSDKEVPGRYGFQKVLQRRRMATYVWAQGDRPSETAA